MNDPQATVPRKSRRRWRRIGVVTLLSLLLATLAAVAGLYWAERLLTIEDRPVKADAEVILGGEPYYRPPRALEIFQNGLASNIVVSGHGDADEVRIWFKAKGVPVSAIHVEPNSRNTQQNARFTVPLLRAQHSKRVIIVTSWFHSRRALACFRKAAPEIEFISLPTVADRPRTHWPNRYERGMVLREYLKLAGYWVRYGVRPFASRKPEAGNLKTEDGGRKPEARSREQGARSKPNIEHRTSNIEHRTSNVEH